MADKPTLFTNLFEGGKEPEPYDIAAIGTQLSQARGRRTGIERAAVESVQHQLAGPAAVADSAAEAIATAINDGLGTPAAVRQMVAAQATKSIVDQLQGPHNVARGYGYQPAGPLGTGAGRSKKGQRRRPPPPTEEGGPAPDSPPPELSPAGAPEGAGADGGQYGPSALAGAAGGPAEASSAGPIPSAGLTAGPFWAVLVDCSAAQLGLFDLSLAQTQQMVQAGAFVPIRYGTYDDLLANWLNRGAPGSWKGNLQYHSQWVAIACHARDTNGDGWPFNGDLPHDMSVTLEQGQPVGPWPFDAQRNYVGG